MYHHLLHSKCFNWILDYKYTRIWITMTFNSLPPPIDTLHISIDTTTKPVEFFHPTPAWLDFIHECLHPVNICLLLIQISQKKTRKCTEEILPQVCLGSVWSVLGFFYEKYFMFIFQSLDRLKWINPRLNVK